MAADQVDGRRGDKSQKQDVNDNGRRAWIKAHNEGASANEFQKRDDNGNQVDENIRKKVISVNNSGEIRGGYNFMETGIDKGEAQNPARCQFDPAIAFYGVSPIIQLDTPLPPSPEIRR